MAMLVAWASSKPLKHQKNSGVQNAPRLDILRAVSNLLIMRDLPEE